MAAVAARDLKKAQEFVKKFDIPNAYGSYQELAQDPNVGQYKDVVMIIFVLEV